MAGIDARGTQFKTEDDASPGTFNAVANVTNITPPGIERETLDVTAHDSEEGWMEFLGGLKNGGEVSIELNYDPAQHDVLVSDMDVSEPLNYKVVFPGGIGEWSFSAVMTGFAPEAPYDGQLTAEVTFQVSGKPVLTVGS